MQVIVVAYLRIMDVIAAILVVEFLWTNDAMILKCEEKTSSGLWSLLFVGSLSCLFLLGMVTAFSDVMFVSNQVDEAHSNV